MFLERNLSRSQNWEILLKPMQRLIDIVKTRGASLNDILEHDLLSTNVLWMATSLWIQPAKHVMTEELRAHLNKEEDFTFKKESELSAGVFVAFMSVVRLVSLKKMHKFIEVLEFLWKSYTKVCKADFIFDSYIKELHKRRWKTTEICSGGLLCNSFN